MHYLRSEQCNDIDRSNLKYYKGRDIGQPIVEVYILSEICGGGAPLVVSLLYQLLITD